jgi:type I restriction enzyme S subunit
MKKGWELTSLIEFCTFSNGLWTGKKPPFQKIGVIRNTNFKKDGNLDDTDIVFIDVEQSQFAKRKLQYGDIILEKSGGGPKQPVGRVVLFNKEEGDFSYSNFTSCIRVLDTRKVYFKYLHKFLYFIYISGATEVMQSNSTGIRNLKFDDYKNIKVPLPPLSEQNEIVSILDNAFESIELAKSNAEQNLKNTKELFDSYLQKIFVNKEDDWEEKTLGELCYKITDGSHNPPKGIDYSAYLMLSSRDIYEEQIHFNKPRYLSKKDFESENKRTAIQAGDVLLTIVGTIGRVAVVPTEFPNFTLQRSVAVLKPNNHIINSYFLKFILQNSLSLLISESRGAAQKGIYLNQLKMIKISIPLISKQHQIVKMLDLLFEETKKLESLYLQKLNDLEELKKSVLLKAFNGELRTSKISA